MTLNLKLFDTLSGEKKLFEPIDSNNISLYVCGPTVYDRPHLGNARSVVVYDLLFRLLQQLFPKVTYARNITDIDDKINAEAKRRKISIGQLAAEIIELFHKDTNALGVLKPTFEPKATEHLAEIIEIITKLIDNKHAYIAAGHVLFDVKSYKEYGQLSNRLLDDLISGARVEVADYKRNPLDFVLWKPADADDDPSIIFDSPWGEGRPGWHIECSAMSNKYLGSNFDIHGGGADLQFPHHENEIAQNICANPGSNFAKYWVHNGFLTVNGEKMSKSLKNFITVSELLEKGVSGTVIRYSLLSTHYRKPFDFNQKVLDDSAKAIDKFYQIVAEIGSFEVTKLENNQYLKQIIDSLSDDLNSPLALSVLHQIAKDFKGEKDVERKLILANNLSECLIFLGFENEEYLSDFITKKSSTNDEINEKDILEQIELRKKAKINKDWPLADQIRNSLLSQNIILKDHPDGSVTWGKK